MTTKKKKSTTPNPIRPNFHLLQDQFSFLQACPICGGEIKMDETEWVGCKNDTDHFEIDTPLPMWKDQKLKLFFNYQTNEQKYFSSLEEIDRYLKLRAFE